MDILRSDTQLRVTPALRETPSGDDKVDQQATHVIELRISHLRLTVQNLIKRTNGRGRSLITPHQTCKRRGGSVKIRENPCLESSSYDVPCRSQRLPPKIEEQRSLNHAKCTTGNSV